MILISRRDAALAGMPSYFTGKPCKQGHVAKRRTSDCACSQCKTERLKSWISRNSERRRLQQAAWRAAHPTAGADWTAANAERHKAATRAWQKANPERMAEYSRRWYSDEKNAQRRRERNSAWWKANPEAKRAKCAARQRPTKTLLAKTYQKQLVAIYRACPAGHEVDHIVPLAGKFVSGLHVPWNLQYLTPLENQRKKNSMPATGG